MGARTWLAALLVVQTLGCASEYKHKQCALPQPSSGKASHLVIYRPIWMFYAVKSPITINGCFVGMLAARAVLSIDVTPGPVIIRAEHSFPGIGSAEIRTRVEASETVFVKYTLDSDSNRHEINRFTFVEKAAAEKDMRALEGGRDDRVR